MENTQRIAQMRRLVEKNGVSTEVRVSMGLFLFGFGMIFYGYVIFVFAEV